MTILTNDDAYGQFSFDSSSTTVSVEETVTIPTAANGALCAVAILKTLIHLCYIVFVHVCTYIQWPHFKWSGQEESLEKCLYLLKWRWQEEKVVTLIHMIPLYQCVNGVFLHSIQISRLHLECLHLRKMKILK